MDPSTNEAFTLRELVKLESTDTHFGDRNDLVRGRHYREYMSAVESVVSTNLKASPPKVIRLTMSGGSAARRPKRLRYSSDRAQPGSAAPQANYDQAGAPGDSLELAQLESAVLASNIEAGNFRT